LGCPADDNVLRFGEKPLLNPRELLLVDWPTSEEVETAGRDPLSIVDRFGERLPTDQIDDRLDLRQVLSVCGSHLPSDHASCRASETGSG
jgi:hypothetical protein